MNRFQNLLFIVDMQNDFCRTDGALYVNGADRDVKRLADFIKRNGEKIDHIVLTLDHHQVIDISHPAFWTDENGNHPPAFTIISSSDIQKGKWQPLYDHQDAIRYIEELSKQGEFPHTIWPEHCIAGSTGAAIVDEIMEQVKNWARTGRFFDLIIKGTNPLTEHFGALRANIPIESKPETSLNMTLVDALARYKNIYIAGEARSHCVANTVKQMLEVGGLTDRMIILWDLMSDIPGFEKLTIPLYNKAFKMGVRQYHSTAVELH